MPTHHPDASVSGEVGGEPVTPESPPSQAGVLNSWKEIARYLGRGVRTVQRWERDLKLPVHRPRGKLRSAVVAIPDELDRWITRSPAAALDNTISNHVKLARQLLDRAEVARTNKSERAKLRAQSKELRQEAVAAREKLRLMMEQLRISARMAKTSAGVKTEGQGGNSEDR